MKREYKWFVLPQNDFSNESISAVLDESKYDDKTHMWQCTFEIAQTFMRSHCLDIKVKTFIQRGKGKIREAPSFFFKRKRKKTKAG